MLRQAIISGAGSLPVSEGVAAAPVHVGNHVGRPANPARAMLYPLRTMEELAAVLEAAREDHHAVLGATHLVRKAGEVVGYLGVLPMFNVWLHSDRMSARDSFTVIREMERLGRLAGHGLICVPCAESSPFRPYMERLGYQCLGQSTLNLKKLKR